MQQSLAENKNKHSKSGGKLGKKRQRSGKNHQRSAKKQKKSSKKRVTRKSKRKGHKSAERGERKPLKRMSGKQSENFKFRSCDYVDLVEVGHRKQSDYNCSVGDKFVLKVIFFV